MKLLLGKMKLVIYIGDTQYPRKNLNKQSSVA